MAQPIPVRVQADAHDDSRFGNHDHRASCGGRRQSAGAKPWDALGQNTQVSTRRYLNLRSKKQC